MDIKNIRNKYNFLVSGDSISRGVIYDETKKKYSISSENYVSIVQEKLNGIINNTSRFGNTVIKGISRLKNEIVKNKPDVVLIEYGGNDCDFNWDEIAANPNDKYEPNTDIKLFEETLSEGVEMLKEKNITPVLLTLPPLNADNYFKWVCKNDPTAERNVLKWLGSVTRIYWWQERYNSSILKIAERTKTRWIDIRGAFLEQPDFTKFICLDGIHPNIEGHRIIAEKIIEFIKSGYDYLLVNNQTAIKKI
ncbi:MAG: SGNH/GDSL hydrolase family protein [Clostridia bacterium]|jgi:lysophospholipase L1-like esterase